MFAVREGVFITRYRAMAPLKRYMSTSTADVRLDIDRASGIAHVTMAKKRVNTMSLEFMTELCNTMDTVEADQDCRGLILKSSVPGIFCAGLELTECDNPDMKRFKPFWRTLQDTWIKIYTSRLATVAAISGHAYAGGCLLALACDHRIMVDDDKYKIGLNETKVGLGVPFWLCDGMAATIGQRRSDEALQLGSVFPAREAFRIGLVDELASPEELLDQANKKVQQWLAIPDGPRRMTKSTLRADHVKKFHAGRDKEVEDFAALIRTEETRRILGQVLAKLGAKKT